MGPAFDAVRIWRPLIAERKGGARGSYALQAAMAAVHARALAAEATDWRRLAALYGELARLAPRPIVELNRAEAVGLAEGLAAGLTVVDGLLGEPSLQRYHLLPGRQG